MVDISELILTARCTYDIKSILRKVIIEVSRRIRSVIIIIVIIIVMCGINDHCNVIGTIKISCSNIGQFIDQAWLYATTTITSCAVMFYILYKNIYLIFHMYI